MHSTQRLHPAARGQSPSSSTDAEAKESAPENRRDRSGEVLAGRYRLLERIGMGGMGSVYRAVHTTIRKPVAVKILDGQYLGQPEFVSRFLREAQAASHLRHEHIVDVTDFGETADGTVFSVMEFLDGEDLAVTLDRDQRLPWPRVKSIALQVLSALDCAHRNGIVHRDIKLENCFRIRQGSNSDFIKVLDFGNAKLIGASAGGESCNFDPQARRAITAMGVIVGTAAYISPEQAEQLPLDARSDLYSVGVMLFELLTGRLPFDAPTFMGVLSKHIHESPPSLRATCPQAEISAEVETLVLRLLAKRPEQRFESASALAQAISEIPDLSSATRPTASITPSRRDHSQSTRRLDLGALHAGNRKPTGTIGRPPADRAAPPAVAAPPLTGPSRTDEPSPGDSASLSRPGTKHIALPLPPKSPAPATAAEPTPPQPDQMASDAAAAKNGSLPVKPTLAIDPNQLAAAEAQWEEFVGNQSASTQNDDPLPGDSIVAAVALTRPNRKLFWLAATGAAALVLSLGWQQLQKGTSSAPLRDESLVVSSLVEPSHHQPAMVIPEEDSDEDGTALPAIEPETAEQDEEIPTPSLMIQFTDDQKITGASAGTKSKAAKTRSKSSGTRSKPASPANEDANAAEPAPAVEFNLPAPLIEDVRQCGRRFGGIPGDRVTLVVNVGGGAAQQVRVQGKRLSNDLEACVTSAIGAASFANAPAGTHTHSVRF